MTCRRAIFSRQSAPEKTAAARAHQAALLEHWGTTPGQDFYISGPGHGGPALVANIISKAPTAEFIRTAARTKRA